MSDRENAGILHTWVLFEDGEAVGVTSIGRVADEWDSQVHASVEKVPKMMLENGSVKAVEDISFSTDNG